MILLQINTTGCDGSDLFWTWLLWLLGAFLLGLLLGWLLKQLFGGSANHDVCIAKVKDLEAELAACRKGKSNLAAGAATLAAASMVADDSVKDDLTKIEGIGPKIKGLLNSDGIWSFVQLAKAPLTQLQQVLDDAGPRYRVHNPKTWAQQSKMAADGHWAELKKWQGELKGGL